jgi:hypothetical protein
MDIVELRGRADAGSVVAVAQSILGLCYLYGEDVDVEQINFLHRSNLLEYLRMD